jgi:hypothetical protein
MPRPKGARIVGVCYDATTVNAVPSAIDMAPPVLVAQAELLLLGNRTIIYAADIVKRQCRGWIPTDS